jgi:hypothetical protein
VVFTSRLRGGIRHGRITCTIRIWQRLKVKVGGRYPMEEGHIVVDSIDRIGLKDITSELAGESGFDSVKDLLAVAKHGSGKNVFLIRFHYLPPGAWDGQRWKQPKRSGARTGTKRLY